MNKINIFEEIGRSVYNRSRKYSPFRLGMDKILNNLDKSTKEEKMKFKIWIYPLLPFYYIGKLSLRMRQDNIFGQQKCKVDKDCELGGSNA